MEPLDVREVKITDDADAFSKQAVEHRQTWVVDNLTHGEQRSVCSIFGALNDIFSRMSASCADNRDKRLIAVFRSEQRFLRRSSIFLPA